MKSLLQSIYDRMYAPLYVRAYSWPPVRDRFVPPLQGMPADFHYSRSGTGFRSSLTVRRLAKRGLVAGKDLLLLGVETGKDIPSLWTRYKPGSILGIDIMPWRKEWNAIQSTTTGIKFAAMDAMNLTLPDSSFDLVYSQSLLEHITDIDRLFSECHRVLRPKGTFHADFGPLWFTFGGPHVAALKYDHLLLDWSEYLSRAREVGNGWEFWIENSLFNRHTLKDYIEAFTRFFHIESLIIAGSPDGERFRSENPDVWQRLTSQFRESDLLSRLVSLTGTARH